MISFFKACHNYPRPSKGRPGARWGVARARLYFMEHMLSPGIWRIVRKMPEDLLALS